MEEKRRKTAATGGSGAQAAAKKGERKGSRGQASHLVPTLEGLRNKLLDLTTRNSLLNLSLNDKRTRRLIRFVHSDLQGTLNALCSGTTLPLTALPDPPEKELREVNDDEFEAALAKARLEDPLYQQILNDSADDKGISPALASAEDRLRSQVREELESLSKKKRSSPNLTRWAEEQGISSSYELPCKSTGRPRKSSGIQTLLLGARLERVAEAIRKQALSSIEETGNNILYLTFGGLSWNVKDKELFAPLILLPVEVSNAGARGGARNYTLRAVDDIPIENVTLRERLKKDFSVELPALDLQEQSIGLASYLEAVEAAVSDNPDWSVRRFMNLSLFSFSGLGLYEDLDPSVVQHSPLVRQILSAEMSSKKEEKGSIRIADDESVDKPEVSGKVPVLITQADASQFAAIADVMEGKSLVIEGPPGTGKSQTITNIIANALYAGKRVLFVAEKKVALDVVFTRLSEAGLKDYCLRIESDKVNKRDVYNELAERLRVIPPLEKNRDSTADAFDELRDELNTFSTQLNRGFGADRKSYQMLIWDELYLRDLLKDAKVSLPDYQIDIENSTTLTRSARDRSAQVFEELAALKQEIPLQRLADTFNAFSELPVDVIEREKLLALAHHWQSSLQSLLEVRSIDAGGKQVSIQSVRDSVSNLRESLSRLPAPIDDDLEWLIEPLSTQEMKAHSDSLISAISAERQSRAKLESLFHREVGALPSAEALTSFLTAWRQWRIGDQDMPQTMREREALAETLGAINEIIERIDIIASSSQYSEQILCCNTQQIENLLSCIQCLADLPKDVLRTRMHDLWSCDTTAITKYLSHYDELEHCRIAIGIQSNHPVLGRTHLDLLQAVNGLEQAEELGCSEQVASAEKIMAWRRRTDKLGQLLVRVDEAFYESDFSFRYEELTISQLALLPDALRDLKGLAFPSLEQGAGTLWSSSLHEVKSLGAGMKEIQALESDLRSQSLVIPTGTSFYVLESAAKKIESTPWLLQAFDGEYSKAIERAKSLGAKGSTTQQAKALRRIAQLLKLRETFPSQRFSELSAVTSSFEESAKIIEKIEGFKSSLQSRGLDELLDFFKNTSSAEVGRLWQIFESRLSADLEGLLEQAWLGIEVGKTTYQNLKSVFQKNRDNLALAEDLYPYVAWRGQAEGAQQSTLKAWLSAIADYINRLDSFPSSELLALTGNQCTLEKALAAMQALKAIQDGLGSWRLEDETVTLIRSIPIADVEPLLVLLRDQLWPSLRVFLDLVSHLGVDSATARVHDLLKNAKQSRLDFLSLVQRHSELGVINDLSVEDLVSAPIDLLLHQKREQELKSALDVFKQCGGDVLGSVSAHDLQQVMAWLEILHNSGLPDSVVSQCLKQDSGAWIRRQSEVGKELSKALQQEAEAAAAFNGKAKAVASQLPGSPSTFDDTSAEHLCQWLSEVCELSEFLSSWLRFRELLAGLPSDAERELAQRLLESAVDGALWPHLYRWNVVRSRLSALTAAQPQLSSLRAADQVARRKRFAKTEDELRRLDRAEVIAAIHNDPDHCQPGISEGLKGDFTEMALIRNESVKRIKHRPLRHLFQYAGNALRGLKPCWMMSPATVASLLPRSKGEDFDLVVIDEASQMSPERALGVISRAKQCVVVGDPQQLPPTSLFQRNAAWEDSDDADEIDTDVLEEESILDLSSKAFQPTRRLKWHYRSRNGSLIAFSNKHFYDSQLVVFPACRREFAITRHLVEESRYKKGVNEPEVRDVCDIVIRQLELYPERTLGVVAMNEAQADAIAEQLDDLAFHHDELRRRLDLRDNSDSLFVKPLEKVQGDERDTIVISTTYGPSEPGGTIPLRFGLLNRASGHRRLNVLFTRAKHAIELVTSLKSSQLRLPATAGPGLVAFRDYLRYVEKGSIDSESSPVREPNTPFEQLVFGVLRRHGFTADCGVGFSNYFIDLAVRHPDAPEHYLLALEGDGANYNSARAARDRDKYRQAVLEALGWNVYKVWSTDWFDNPEGESKKLLSHLKRLRKSVVIPCDHTEALGVKNTISARPRDGNSPSDAAESSDLPEPDPEPEPVSAVAGTHHEQSPISESQLSDHHQSEQCTECFVSKTSSALRTQAQLPEPNGSTTGTLPPSEACLSIKEPEEDVDSSASTSSTQPSVQSTPFQSSQDSFTASPTLQASTITGPTAPPDLVLTSVKHSDTIQPKQPAKGVPTPMPEAVLAPGARIECRSAEWLVRSLGRSSDGQQVVDVVGVSPFLREKEARFLVEVEKAAGSFKVLQPEDTALVSDPSPRYRNSLLFLEAHLRRSVPTDNALVVGQRAAMDALPYQLEPTAKALAMPRQRLLIADAVGLGKTLECGILCSELIRRGRGKRLLVVTTKSMLVQFQKEFWTRFSIPLVRLDSLGIQRIREQIPTNQNPFHYYDKAIVSVDTLKNDRDYRFYLDNANWDIIVIDECQNVAERARGAQKSQRARLAKRLATRSETLILLSATPHDGKPESFASLMDMLDPTAIADPSKYTKNDIKDLYVRRFRKDVKADLRSSVKERETADVECAASEREERVFALLKDLKLPDSDAKAKAGQLFKTTLAKSLLSSPMAALETVRNRLKRLAAAASPAPADQAALEELEPLLAAIGPADFSKYQRLLQLIRSDWNWSGQDPRDRIVLFTGRRETQRFLVEHLAADLGLPKAAVVRLDGAMPDVEQTKVVEQFAQEKEAVRILVATEVASEGLNLHYLSHRLVHVDIPWSLMTLQQRNGRIDRYGQLKQPQIRYLLSCSRSDGMGDAEKVLRLLKRKDEQAQENIGDPAVFLGVYDAAGEEDAISEAFESGSVDELEQRMDANAEPYLHQSSGDSLFDELFASADGVSAEGSEDLAQPTTVQQRQPFSLFPSLWSYVDTALEAVAEQMERRGEKLDLRADADQQRLEITPPSDLQRRYDRYPRELQPPRGQRLVLSTEVAALQRALEQSRRQDSSRPELEYLWDLHPLVDWLADRGQISFQRHCAPVLQLSDGLEPGEVVMVFQGTIPNQKGVPVVQEWVAVRFAGTGLNVVAVEPFEAVAERLQLGHKPYANPNDAIPEHLRKQLPFAVRKANDYLMSCAERWTGRMQPELQAQRERLKRLRGRQVEQLELSYANDQRPQQIKEKGRLAQQKAIDVRFDDHERFVNEVMTIEPAPYLKVVAVLHREA